MRRAIGPGYRLAVCVALLAVVGGCEPRYGGIHFDELSNLPGYAEMGRGPIMLPVGSAVHVEAELESTRRFVDYDESNELELVSDSRGTVEVKRTFEADEFVFIAVERGETCIEVIVDDDEKECVAVEVY
jgi:hypothetical protein